MDPLSVALRRLCRAYVTGDVVGLPPDPAAVLDLARRHRVTPIVARLVEPHLRSTDRLAAVLRRERRLAAARSLALGCLAEELLGPLASAGLPVLVLKGLSLGTLYYRSPEDRPMRDVDLLVRSHDVDAVLEVAASLGFARYADRHPVAFARRFGSALVLTHAPDDLTHPSIDLHWRLLDDWRRGRSEGWEDAAWRTAEPLTVGTRAALCPAPAAMLVHLAAHLGLHHAFDGLLWYVDLALVVKRVAARRDWEDACALAERLGVAGTVALALEAMEALLDVPVPAAIRAALGRRRLRLARRLVLPRVLALRPTAHLEHVLPLLLHDDWHACSRTVLRTVAPPPGWVRLRYARSPWPAGYVRHLGAGVALLGRTIRRALPATRTAG